MARRGPRERSRAAAGKPPDALWQERPARPAQTAASDAVIARAPAHPLAKRTTSEGRTTGPPHGRTIAPKNAEDAVTEAASGNLLQRRARKPVAELGGEPYTLWLRSLRPRNRVWGKPFMSPNRRQDPPRSDSASSAFSRCREPRDGAGLRGQTLLSGVPLRPQRERCLRGTKPGPPHERT